MSSVLSTSNFQSREDARKAKELEEARKAGTAEPEKDEEGNAINPHIPQYISKAPWYLHQQKPGLKHQRYRPAEKEDISIWYDRGRKKTSSLLYEDEKKRRIKYERGACANCGAKTHTEKECTERPRMKKAKFTNENLCEDEEVLTDLKLSFDGKRDRYAGYDPSEYRWVIRDYELAEVERKRRKAQELQSQLDHLKKQTRKFKKKRRLEKKEREKKKEQEKKKKKGDNVKGGGDQEKEEEDGETGKEKDENGVEESNPEEGEKKNEKKKKENGGGSHTETEDTSDEEEEKEEEEDAEKKKKKRKKGEKNTKEDGEGEEHRDSTDTSEESHTSDSDTSSSSSSSSDEDDVKQHDFDQTSAPVASNDDRYRISTKNLRIREDTAKYLLNLDVNSAFYDPKSRSMRGNPFENLQQQQQQAQQQGDEEGRRHHSHDRMAPSLFQGDNRARTTGDVLDAQKLQVFAWEAYKHGAQVHFNAQPTQLEKLYQQHTDKKKALEEEKKRSLLEKYGGGEHLTADPRALYSQTEAYVEYSRDGTVCKSGRSLRRAFVKSKYEEDVYVGSHTSVYGSWYNLATHTWGYACCKQTNFHADCTGSRPEDLLTKESIGLVSSSSSQNKEREGEKERRDRRDEAQKKEEEEEEKEEEDNEKEKEGGDANDKDRKTKQKHSASEEEEETKKKKKK